MITPTMTDWKLSKDTTEYQAAWKVGAALDQAHRDFISAMSKESVSEQEILKAKEKLQRAQRIYTALSEVLDSAHSILMNLIRSLKP